MRRTRLYLIVLAALLVAIGACAPKAAPTPAPVTPQVTPLIPAPTAPAIRPEDAAWGQVVAEAKKEGKVTPYTYGFTGDIGKAVSRAFEAKYGIKVEYVTGVGTVLIERTRSEHAAKKYVADTLDTDISLVILAKQEGLLQSVGDLPSLRQKDAWKQNPIFDPEAQLLALRSAVFSPFVNTSLVRPGEEPKSYRELLEPKWKGRMAFDSPVTSPAGIRVYIIMKKAGLLDDEYWRQLARQELKMGPTFRDPTVWAARGEVALAIVSADVTAAPLVKEGAPLRPVEMAEGSIVAPASLGLVLVKDAPHPNAARVYINWLLSPEGQAIYAKAVGGFLPLRNDVEDIRPAAIRLESKRTHTVDLPTMMEATRVQREGILAKLLGLEK